MLTNLQNIQKLSNIKRMVINTKYTEQRFSKEWFGWIFELNKFLK